MLDKQEEVSTLAKEIVEVIDVLPKLIDLNVHISLKFTSTLEIMSKLKRISAIF